MTNRLETNDVRRLLDAVAAKTPTPGGGAVASMVGALGAALAQMVVNYSIGKKKLAEYESDLCEAIAQCQRARSAMLELAHEDAEAYAALNELSKLPVDDTRRKTEMPVAAALASQAPMTTAAGAMTLLRLFDSLTEKTNPYLKSDLAIAAILASATVRTSAQNVRVNLPTMREVGLGRRADELAIEIDVLVAGAGELESRIVAACS